MAYNNLQILNFSHNIVSLSNGNTLVITDNIKGNSINIPEPITHILQINSPGPQGPAGPSGSQGPSGSGGGGNINTGSFATTGSNTFYGLQTMSASNPGLSALDIHVANDYPWAFRIYNDTYSTSLAGLTSWISNEGISLLGTETDRPLYIYNNGQANGYQPTLIISSSGVTIAGSSTTNINSGAFTSY